MLSEELEAVRANTWAVVPGPYTVRYHAEVIRPLTVTVGDGEDKVIDLTPANEARAFVHVTREPDGLASHVPSRSYACANLNDVFVVATQAPADVNTDYAPSRYDALHRTLTTDRGRASIGDNRPWFVVTFDPAGNDQTVRGTPCDTAGGPFDQPVSHPAVEPPGAAAERLSPQAVSYRSGAGGTRAARAVHPWKWESEDPVSGLYLVWTDKFTVNVPIIDEQHRGIVCTINSFWFSVQSGDGVQALAPTLAVLEQYTKLHFKTEEAMLAKAAFPGLKEHVALHRKLVHDMGRVASDATATGNPSLLLDFLRTWWRDHILASDRDYATHVAAHAPAGGW